MKNRKYYITQTLLILGMAVVCLLFLLPIIFMITSSFETDEEILTDGFKLFPKNWTFDNYINIFEATEIPVLRWLANSFIVAFASAILTVIIASLSAFAYARMKFKGRKLLFSFLLLTMMIPSVISLIPNYLTISTLQLKNKLTALIIPCLGGVVNVFLIRQFLYNIPKELDEAALIDGANYLKLFIRIILPQMVPILVVVGLNTFLGSWNDLLWPLIVNSDADMRTMTSGLKIVQSLFEMKWGSIMAITVISGLPVLVIYCFAQKYLIRGISLTSGMKE